MGDEFISVVQKVDLVIAETAEFAQSGPRFRIVHRFWQPGTLCTPGEEIAAVFLVYHSREYTLRLSQAQRLFFDYLAHHSRYPQSATQIEAGIRSNLFYMKHASRVPLNDKLVRRIPRSAVRVYIPRLRAALADAFKDAGLQIDPCAFVISRKTTTKEVGYQLRATFEWIHVTA